MQRWEYKWIVNDNVDKLNKFGEQGWEAAYPVQDLLLMKRPLPDLELPPQGTAKLSELQTPAQQRDEAQQEAQEWRERLYIYGRHQETCGIYQVLSQLPKISRPCSCGFQYCFDHLKAEFDPPANMEGDGR